MLEVPKLDTTVRVTRSGDLREQHMTGAIKGRLKTKLGSLSLGDASAEVTGVVQNSQLVGRCKIVSDFGTVDEPLDPVPVPQGQVLNPMMPVSRLQDVQPGRRWVIRQIDPLRTPSTLLRQVASKSNLAAGRDPAAGRRRADRGGEVVARAAGAAGQGAGRVLGDRVPRRRGAGPDLGERGRRPGDSPGGVRVRRAAAVRAGHLPLGGQTPPPPGHDPSRQRPSKAAATRAKPKPNGRRPPFRHSNGLLVRLVIELTNVTKRYGPKVAVEDLNLSVPAGELFAFLGPNGAGKTTTIKMLCGLLFPTEGTVRVGGFDLRTEGDAGPAAHQLRPRPAVPVREADRPRVPAVHRRPVRHGAATTPPTGSRR